MAGILEFRRSIKAVWSDFFTGPVWKYGIYV